VIGVLPAGQSLAIQVLQNGAFVPGLQITYLPGEGGIKVVAIPPFLFPASPNPNSQLDVQLQSSIGAGDLLPIDVTAVVT